MWSREGKGEGEGDAATATGRGSEGDTAHAHSRPAMPCGAQRVSGSFRTLSNCKSRWAGPKSMEAKATRAFYPGSVPRRVAADFGSGPVCP